MTICGARNGSQPHKSDIRRCEVNQLTGDTEPDSDPLTETGSDNANGTSNHTGGDIDIGGQTQA